MNKDYINNFQMLAGIDTLSIKNVTDNPYDEKAYPYINQKVSRALNKNYTYYRINPDKYDTSRTISDYGIYDFVEYKQTLTQILSEMNLDNPIKNRIDMRFDRFDDNSYTDMLKMNKLLILLIAKHEDIEKRYQSYDFMTMRDLTIRIQDNRLEMENYNKAEEEPNGIVKSRLELRTKYFDPTTPEDLKELLLWEEWKERMSRSITKNNLDSLSWELNKFLLQVYPDFRYEISNGKQLSQSHILTLFLIAYRNQFFTRSQMIDFIDMVKRSKWIECGNPAKRYEYYVKKYNFNLYSLYNVTLYFKRLCSFADEFYKNSYTKSRKFSA